MRALARLAQQEDGAAGDDLLAERDEGGDDLAQRQQLRPAAVQRQHVDAEAGLQRRVAVELVEHDIGRGVALQLDDHAHAVAVALVAQIGDALDQLLAHAFGDALDHARLVDLIRHLGDDDRLALLAALLEMRLAAHHDRAAAELVGGMDAHAADDAAAGREIRARHQLHQLVGGDRGVVDEGDAGVDHLAEIVRRDVGRHADGDAGAAIDQDVGKARRQHPRLLARAVVIRLEVDGVLVDVAEQRVGGAGEARFGVAHRRRRVAVHRAEIALAVDQPHPHGEILRHAHHARRRSRRCHEDGIAP